jgi:hypothetical protein
VFSIGRKKDHIEYGKTHRTATVSWQKGEIYSLSVIVTAEKKTFALLFTQFLPEFKST